MVIVGGGCAGVAAAWQLAGSERYKVSVYEQTPRLGGKGASMRAADGRILEHGLHVWLGFYENAFRMIRECYDEVEWRGWGPDGAVPSDRLAHARFADAFLPEPHIGVSGTNAGEHVVWSGLLPPEKGLPGDPIAAGMNPFTLANYLLRCVHLLKTLMLSVVGTPAEDVPGRKRPEARSTLDEQLDLRFSLGLTESPELFIQTIARRVRGGTLTVAAGLLQAVTIFESVLQDFNHSPQVAGSTLNLMKALATQTRKQLRDLVSIDERLRWKTEIIDIVMTIAVGLYRDRVLLDSKGLDALNAFDYREWLEKHGATKTSLNSRFITGIYDLVFAYKRGDRNKPRLAAGVALRGALRMFFTYRGSMFWRMRSGMGDTVFAPLYRVMKSGRRDRRSGGATTLRGVDFHFQHELADVGFDATDRSRPFVAELTFLDRSGATVDDALDHLGCWPETVATSAADREARRRGRQTSSTKRTLQVGRDFDAVIFANGFHAFADIVNGKTSRGLGDAVPKPWLRAVEFEREQTVATKAAQSWLGNTLEELGWYRGPGIVAALGGSFETWADMTHTLPSERAWRQAPGAMPKRATRSGDSAEAARSVAYFCGVLPDKELPPDLASLERQFDAFLVADMPRLWPETLGPTKLERIETHVQANVRGSDRYALSLPGTIDRRLSPLDGSVSNATVAGDWTACGIDAGCVEAAVISGMLAAHAIDGTEPPLEHIIGYDHP